MKSAWLALSLLVPATACAVDGDKGPEEDAPSLDGKDDSLRRPTDHGHIGFDAPVTAEIAGSERHHAWTFELSDEADIIASTGPAAGGDEVDTVLYLYRKRENGTWGSYIARNDDRGGTLWSSFQRTLQAGEYRLIVKGYDRTVEGPFALELQCDGQGCAAPLPACVLGDTYNEIESQPALELINRVQVTIADEWVREPAWAARFVLAVQQSSHTDVTTVEEAFSRVDQNEMNVTWFAEPAARRKFVAIEYGAGDNSYGAVFGDGTTIVASIHDGDLLGCETPAETCLLPATYRDLMEDPAFERAATRTITSAAQVTGIEAQQVLRALQSVYGGEAGTLNEGLQLADNNEVLLTPATHRTTDAAITIVQFGAGDTSVGLVFYAGSLDQAAVINDLALEQCTLFAD
jgi:hypothetical protein